MKKRLFVLILALVIAVTGMSTLLVVPSEASNMQLKNWQQCEPGSSWAGVYFDGYTFGSSGCGVMSTVNTVHYLTGNWMDPIMVANWAHSIGAYNGIEGTYRERLYPNVTAKFGAQYGFKVVWYGGGSTKDSRFLEHIRNGGTAVVHVKNHYMAVVDYDESTKKFLLWDNAAEYYSSTRRYVTHVAGDWFTADQLQGDISSYVNVDYYVLFSATNGGNTQTNKTFVARDEIMCGTTKLVTSGGIADGISLDLSSYVGKEIKYCGWYATKAAAISSFGYSVDGGSITWNSGWKSGLSTSAQSAANSNVGTPNYTGYFTIPIKVSDAGKHTYKLYAKVGSENVLIWTINSSITTFTARDEIICEGNKLYSSGYIPDGVSVPLGNYAGKDVEFYGWYANKKAAISSFGYSIDGGSIKYSTGYLGTPSTGAQGHADVQIGTPNYCKKYVIPVRIPNSSAHTIKIYAKVGTSDVLIWTINGTAGSQSTQKPATPTPKPAATPTPGTSGISISKTTVVYNTSTKKFTGTEKITISGKGTTDSSWIAVTDLKPTAEDKTSVTTCVNHYKGNYYNWLYVRKGTQFNLADVVETSYGLGGITKTGKDYFIVLFDKDADYKVLDYVTVRVNGSSSDSDIKEFIARDELCCGTEQLGYSGIPNLKEYSLGKHVGEMLNFKGWYATTDTTVNAFGYSIDGGTPVYKQTFISAVSEGAQGHANAQIGTPNFTGYFDVSILVPDGNAHTYTIFAKIGSTEKAIWTVNQKAEPGATPKAPTDDGKKYVSREDIYCGGEKLSQNGINDGMKVKLGSHVGENLTIKGWYATKTANIAKFGYSVDGGNIVYKESFKDILSDNAQSNANNKVGSPNYTACYNVEIPVTDANAHVFKVYAKVGTQDVLIWTINAEKDTNATKAPASPTPGSNPIESFLPGDPGSNIDPETSPEPVNPDETISPDEPVETVIPENTGAPSATEDVEYEYIEVTEYNWIAIIGLIVLALLIIGSVILFIILRKKQKR